MNKQIIIFVCIFVGVIAFFFFQNKERYFKKKTLKLLHIMADLHSDPASPIVFFQKVRSLTKHTYFSVHYEVKWGSRLYQNSSTNRLRSDLHTWFRQKPTYQMEIPSQESLKVFLQNKKAEVNFTVPFIYKEQKKLCKTNIHWGKEKYWVIHKIQALCH